MTINELNLIRECHKKTMRSVLNIIASNMDKIPGKMITELAKFDKNVYQKIDECIEYQLNH